MIYHKSSRMKEFDSFWSHKKMLALQSTLQTDIDSAIARRNKKQFETFWNVSIKILLTVRWLFKQKNIKLKVSSQQETLAQISRKTSHGIFTLIMLLKKRSSENCPFWRVLPANTKMHVKCILDRSYGVSIFTRLKCMVPK